MKAKLSRVLLYGVLLALAVFFLFPFYWVIISSAKSRECYAMTPPAFYPCEQETVSTSAPTEGRIFRRGENLWFRLIASRELLTPGNDAHGAYYVRLDDGAVTQRVEWFADEAVEIAGGHHKRLALPDLPVCRLQDCGDTVAVVAKVLRTRGEGFDEILFYVDRSDPSMDTIQMAHNAPYKRVMTWAPRWENFVETLKGPEVTIGSRTSSGFLLFIRNSLFIAVMAVIGQVFGSSLAAYAFARLRFKGRDVFFIVVLATMMIPAQVTLIPMFSVYKHLGWLNTYLPMIVPHFCGSAFGIFLIRQYMLGIPKDLDEAAAIDGCGLFRTYCHVILPNCIPILIVVGIFTFVASWQDVLSPLIYIDDPHLRTVPLGLEYFRSPYVDNRHLLMTGSLLAMLPVGLFFIIFQRFIMAGIATTGVKG